MVICITTVEFSDGTYGENCTGICSIDFIQQCDKVTDNCICESGFWGNSCNQTCPTFYEENMCSSDTRNCYSCIAGYYGVKCQNKCSLGCKKCCNMISGLCLCGSGFYSSNCSLQCPSNCVHNECLQETAHCLSCNI